MRIACWAIIHTVNSVCAILLWLAVFVLVVLQYVDQKNTHARISSMAIEEMIFVSVTSVFFLLFRFVQGTFSLRSLLGQARNPLMHRSSTTQILCVVYSISSMASLYFILVANADQDADLVGSVPLQLSAVALGICSFVFIVEQFSHPQLIDCFNGENIVRKRPSTIRLSNIDTAFNDELVSLGIGSSPCDNDDGSVSDATEVPLENDNDALS